MILEAQKLCKVYQQDSRALSAVDDASLSIAEGEFVCVAGRSGSGKSTLLNILTGLLTPTSGTVIFEGQNYAAMDDEALSRLRRTRLGYIMQGVSVLPNFTVLQNLILPYALPRYDDSLVENARLTLEQTGIAHLASQYPSNLSGGELRRVAIARTLLMSPRLLVADEPTGDLDEETAAEVMRLFGSIVADGTAILMVTHDTEAIGCASRVLTMKAGRLSPALEKPPAPQA
ncbi:MAG: ABC transporter ATP-binding protein [Coriobacteriales bacterium]|jgi:putative ABC transport system ATP-binding protein|nr:ABC transporter ATP-binding protein [Coriobacteriales bacterium]